MRIKRRFWIIVSILIIALSAVFVCACRGGDEEVSYIPNDTNGSESLSGNIEPQIPTYEEIEVLVLMYHDIREYEVRGNSSIISTAAFREQLETLSRRGYEVITFDDLIAFVDHGKDLPRRTVVITFDDGHRSNLELAAPILAELGMSATISLIGIQMGKSTYRDTYIRTMPHFDFYEALPWTESGVIQIGHHSYDMHWVDWIELTWSGADLTIPFRRGILQRAGESDAEWRAAFVRDFELLRDMIYENLGIDVNVYVYPYGLFNAATEEVLRELGVRVTLTTNPGINLVEHGNPDSLFALNRFNMDDDMVGERLARFLDDVWR